MAVRDDSQVQARVKQASKALAVIAAQVKAAQTSLALLKKEVPISIKIAEYGVAHARAMIAEAESVLDDLTIVAPSQGMITTRVVDQGEVVNAGAPLLDLVNLDRLYLVNNPDHCLSPGMPADAVIR